MDQTSTDQVVSGGSNSTFGLFNQGTFAFENAAASLVPFDIRELQNEILDPDYAGSHALAPIAATNGLVFPFNPAISEGISVRYKNVDLVHSNEAVHTYEMTDNVRISLSDCNWVCDTFHNAVYTLSVLHFFRTYSLMDFGKFMTARPPCPMWFNAYGNYAFWRVPVLMEKADWNFPNDIDYVGVPEPGEPEWRQCKLVTNRSSSTRCTWLPIRFTVNSISLIVQHSPRYWINFDLNDYRSGAMMRRNGSFHTTNPAKTQPRVRGSRTSSPIGQGGYVGSSGSSGSGGG